MLTYPMAVGRNFDEILRVVPALQFSSKHPIVTPANWEQNDYVIIDPSISSEEAGRKFPKGHKGVTPYLRYIE